MNSIAVYSVQVYTARPWKGADADKHRVLFLSENAYKYL